MGLMALNLCVGSKYIRGLVFCSTGRESPCNRRVRRTKPLLLYRFYPEGINLLSGFFAGLAVNCRSAVSKLRSDLSLLR